MKSWHCFLATFVHAELVKAPFLGEHVEMVTFLAESMTMQCFVGVISLSSRQGFAEVRSLSLKRGVMCLLLLGVLYIQGSVEQWLVVQRVGSRLGEFGGVVVCRATMVVLVAVIFRGAENCGVGGEVVRDLQVAFGSTGLVPEWRWRF